MKKIFFNLFLLLFLSCQKISPLSQKTEDVRIQSKSYSLTDLNKSRVNELFVVLFKKSLTQNEWAEIFKDTQKLSSNKRLLLTIDGLFDERSEEVRSTVIQENADLLQRLSAQSVYLLNWSFGDENCRFLFQEKLNLVCKPRVLDNPLNGGLPQQQGLIEVVNPDPVISEVKQPYISLILFRQAPLLQFELRLKLESQSQTELWFKGDVKLLSHSFSEAPYDYGYAEMTLAKPAAL